MISWCWESYFGLVVHLGLSQRPSPQTVTLISFNQVMKLNKRLVARESPTPIMAMYMWLIMVGCLIKDKFWLILVIILDQHSLN